MAITGILNTLVQADTSQFDGKMKSSGDKITTLRTVVEKQSAGMQSAWSNFTSISGLEGLLGGTVSNITGMFSSLTSVVSGMWAALLGPIGIAIGLFAAFAAVVSAGAIALHAMASKGAESIRELSILATQLGTTTAAMAGLSMMGDSTEALRTGIAQMQAQLDNVSPQAALAFSRMGISPEHLRSMNDASAQLRMIADGYGRLNNQVERMAAVRSIFGEGGVRMIDDLARGSAGIDQLQARAERFGLTFTESQAAALRSATREWAGLGMAMDGIGRQAAVMFTPAWEAIGKVGSAIGEWIVGAFRQAQPYMERFGSGLATMFGPIWEIIKNVAAGLGRIFMASIPLIEQFARLVLTTFHTLFSIFPANGIVEAMIGDGASVDGFVNAIISMIPWIKIGLEVFTAIVQCVGDIARLIWQGLWLGIKAVGSIAVEVFGYFTSWIPDFMTEWGSAREAIIGTLAVIVVGARNIRSVFTLAVDAIKLAWLVMIQAVAGAFAAFTRGFHSSVVAPMINMIRSLISTLSEVAELDPTGAMTAGLRRARTALNDIANSTRGMRIAFDTPDIDRQVNALRARQNAAMDNFGRQVRDQIRQWNFELAGGMLGAAAAAVAAARANVQPLVVGQLRADTSHGAVTAQSERAFSMLYGTRGQQDYYQRLAAERLTDVRQVLVDVRNEMRQAPAIRRARL